MDYIAEIGWNFLGDISLAKKMIAAARDADATYAKFQIWDPEHLKSGPWDLDGRREIYQKAFLNDEKISFLQQVCEEEGIKFLASVFETRSLSKLRLLGAVNVKIPSHECNNWQLIDQAILSFDHVFLSVGAVSQSDLLSILEKYSKVSNVTIMHCVSTYPLASDNVNLPKLLRLKLECANIGYSSHYTGVEDAVAATALGAKLIEKHFTTDRELPGRDNKFALLPNEFHHMVQSCNNVHCMLKDLGDDIQPVEQDVAKIMRGRWDGDTRD